MNGFGEQFDYTLTNASVGASDNNVEGLGHAGSEVAFVIDTGEREGHPNFKERLSCTLRLVGVVMSTQMNDVTNRLAFTDGF